MFLAITSHDTTNRGIQECFQYSREIISQCFYKVLNAFILMHAYYIQLPLNTYKTDARFRDNLEYRPYFRDCLDALDRTYIPTHIFYANQILY